MSQILNSPLTLDILLAIVGLSVVIVPAGALFIFLRVRRMDRNFEDRIRKNVRF